MKIKYCRLHPFAKDPKKAHDVDACYDLYVAEVLPAGDKYQYAYDTGIAFNIPPGWFGLVFPRSSVKNTGLMLSNCVGVIDSGYSGTVKVFMNKIAPEIVPYAIGDRVAQIVIKKLDDYELTEVSSLDEFSKYSDRGDGGYGSTGR